MKKKDIRRYYKEKRQELTASQINKMDDLMLIHFQQLPIDIPSSIMTYAAMEHLKEFNPQLITDYCYFKNPNQILSYPVMNEQQEISEMISMAVDEETLFETNEFGIAEPIDGKKIMPGSIEMLIVPLLGFDTKGYRVGYGKGYYDRFLKKCNTDCIKVGFSYFDPVDVIEDINTFDIPLDFCITHEKFFEF